MRNILCCAMITLLFGVTSASLAQSANDLHVHASSVTGLASFVTPREPGSLSMTQTVGQSVAERFLDTYGLLFGVKDRTRELQLRDVVIDRIGHTRTAFQQVYQGIKVYSGLLYVHQNAGGAFVAANGDFYPITVKSPLTQSVTFDAAYQIALEELGVTGIGVESHELVLVDPAWYGDPPRGVHLAYHLVLNNQLSPLQTDTGDSPLREAMFIDAHSGVLLDRWSMVYDAIDRRIHDAHAGSDCCYLHEGMGCDDAECAAAVCDGFPLCCEQNWSNSCGARATRYCADLCLPGPLLRAEGDAPTGEPGVDALYDYYGDTYDFYRRAFGRDSYDDDGAAIVCTLNSPLLGCPNAAWLGGIQQMLFCDGTTSDDIVAHEYTHAITESTAELIYQNQPGQLNESFSDVFGELIDLFNGNASDAGAPGGTAWPTHPSGPGHDEPNNPRTMCSDPATGYSDGVRWLVGEDSAAFGDAIRDMWDPTCLGDPDYANSPLQGCSLIDAGGVHSGSGIPNHAFALLTDGGSFNDVDIEGIGAIKAGAVWYRALTTYLSIASDFEEAYISLNQSALDLVGTYVNDPRTGMPMSDPFSAHDAEQVDRALRAVEMNTPGRCGASVDILSSAPAPICAEAVTIFEDDFEGDVSGWSVSNEGEFGPPTPYDWIPTEDPLPFDRPGVAWFCADPSIGDCFEQNESALHSLFSPVIDLPADVDFPYLAFTHYLASEGGWDGGRVAVRVNGGLWIPVGRERFVFNPYNSALRYGTSYNFNPLALQNVWSGLGGRWGTSIIDLRHLAGPGDQLEIRFDFGKDGCTGLRGWYVDDVKVYHCPDCNRNDVPDVRERHFTAYTQATGQIGHHRPQRFVFQNLPLSDGEVTITIRAQADLSADSEWLEVWLNQTRLGPVFVTGANDCAGTSDEATIVVPQATFNDLLTHGEDLFDVTASNQVSPTLCNQMSFVSLDLSYPLAHRDADNNGVLDECENCAVGAEPLAEPAGVSKSRYISFVPQDAGRYTAWQVTFVDLPDAYQNMIGRQMWLGPPRIISDPRFSGTNEELVASTLSCSPAFYDWGSLGTVHVTGEWIIPESKYEVRSIDLACDVDSPSYYSLPLTLETGRWGDVAGTCGESACPEPDGIVDVHDVSATLDSFRGLPGSLLPVQADLAGTTPNAIVDISDVIHVSDAFAGHAYPFVPMDHCNSTE